MENPARSSIPATRVDELAQIELTAQEVVELESQFQQILRFVDRISQFDLSDVEPWYSATADNLATPDHLPLREDVVEPGFTSEIATRNAAVTEGPFFLVPDVFQSESEPDE